jgi:hypothetical protein
MREYFTQMRRAGFDIGLSVRKLAEHIRMAATNALSMR